ncbi:MAG: hypothetical protein RL217_1312 [Pseudomonadota bacterium]|jgi:short-subunit dehydrogenase
MTLKTVLITGCSSGIGRALAQTYLQADYKVYACARRLETLNSLHHSRLVPIKMDVNNPQDIEQALQKITEDSGYLDCLINNAGFAAMGPVSELSTENLAQQFATNVFAPVALTKAFLPLLRHNATASSLSQIINIGSISGILTTPFSGAYCATKAALHSLSDALRMELKPFHIEVITIQPGGIESEFGNNSLKNLAGILADDSIFMPLKIQIEARATASQENPTPAAEFAQILFEKTQHKPKAEIRIGHGSTLLPLIKRLLPTKLVDKILSKKFGLNSLQKQQ